MGENKAGIGNLNFGPRTSPRASGGAESRNRSGVGKLGLGVGAGAGRLDLQQRGIKHSLTSHHM